MTSCPQDTGYKDGKANEKDAVNPPVGSSSGPPTKQSGKKKSFQFGRVRSMSRGKMRKGRDAAGGTTALSSDNADAKQRHRSPARTLAVVRDRAASLAGVIRHDAAAASGSASRVPQAAAAASPAKPQPLSRVGEEKESMPEEPESAPSEGEGKELTEDAKNPATLLGIVVLQNFPESDTNSWIVKFCLVTNAHSSRLPSQNRRPARVHQHKLNKKQLINLDDFFYSSMLVQHVPHIVLKREMTLDRDYSGKRLLSIEMTLERDCSQ